MSQVYPCLYHLQSPASLNAERATGALAFWPGVPKRQSGLVNRALNGDTGKVTQIFQVPLTCFHFPICKMETFSKAPGDL